MAEQISDDEEKYVPAGLAHCGDNKLRPDLIEEFYKPASVPSPISTLQESKTGSTPELIDLTVSTPQASKQSPISLEIPKYPSMAASAPVSPSDILRSMPSPLMYQRPPINYAMSPMPYSVGVPRSHMPFSMPPSPILPIWPGYIMMPVPPHCYPIPQMVPMNVFPHTPSPVPERVPSPEIDVEAVSESSINEERNTSKIKKRKIHVEVDGDADRECERPEKIDSKKDVFVIRLKDVDSFDRSNEIWRVDNNVLIQKFTGVPSLRAPARQFQSTNRMCGYDRRADWRFFVIDAHNVEYDRFSHEITVHRFPTLEMLREAKMIAEKKDETFKDTEMTEYREKLLEMEKKKDDRKKEKARRKLERIQKRMARSKRKLDTNSNYDDSRNGNRTKVAYKWPKKCGKKVNDEIAEVCQDVLELIVDQVVAQFEEILDSEESEYSDEDLEGYDCTDDEYCEQEEKYPLFDQEDVPEVGLEMTIKSIPNPV